MAKRRIAPQLLPMVLESMRNTGKVSRQEAQLGYEKWQVGAAAESCIFGDDRHLAIDCECRGCHERMMFVMLDQVLMQEPQLLTTLNLGK